MGLLSNIRRRLRHSGTKADTPSPECEPKTVFKKDVTIKGNYMTLPNVYIEGNLTIITDTPDSVYITNPFINGQVEQYKHTPNPWLSQQDTRSTKANKGGQKNA